MASREEVTRSLKVVYAFQDELSGGAEAATKKAEGSLDSLVAHGEGASSHLVASLSRIATGFFSIHSSIRILEQAFSAAEESRRSHTLLAVALSNVGQAAEIGPIEAWAGALQGTTKVSDEAISRMYAVVKAETDVQNSVPTATIERAIELMLDYAAAHGDAAESIQQKFIPFLSGATDNVRGMNLELAKGADVATRYAVLNQHLAQTVGGTAAAIVTSTDAMKSAWDQALEAFGNTTPIQGASLALEETAKILEAVSKASLKPILPAGPPGFEAEMARLRGTITIPPTLDSSKVAALQGIVDRVRAELLAVNPAAQPAIAATDNLGLSALAFQANITKATHAAIEGLHATQAAAAAAASAFDKVMNARQAMEAEDEAAARGIQQLQDRLSDLNLDALTTRVAFGEMTSAEVWDAFVARLGDSRQMLELIAPIVDEIAGNARDIRKGFGIGEEKQPGGGSTETRGAPLTADLTIRQESLKRAEQQIQAIAAGIGDEIAFGLGPALMGEEKDFVKNLAHDMGQAVTGRFFKAFTDRAADALLKPVLTLADKAGEAVFGSIASALVTNVAGIEGGAAAAAGTIVAGASSAGGLLVGAGSAAGGELWAGGSAAASAMIAGATTAAAILAAASIVGAQSGGLIHGKPGTDQNLLAVSSGEFVVNERSTRAFLPLLQAINTKRFDPMVFRAPARGGRGAASLSAGDGTLPAPSTRGASAAGGGDFQGTIVVYADSETQARSIGRGVGRALAREMRRRRR